MDIRGKRLLLVGGAGLIGSHTVDALIPEDVAEIRIYDNFTFYGATKIAGEQILRALYDRYGREKGAAYVGLRYMNVYGPRQDYRGAYVAVVMKMLDRIDEGLPPVVYGDGSQAYDFVYVGDCGRANVLAIKADSADAFYNVGTGVKTTIKETAELVLELTGARTGIRYEPAGPTFVKNRAGATAKAEPQPGFRAESPLREGLRGLTQARRRPQDAVAQRREQASTPS